MAGKSGFTQREFEEIKRLYVEEGRTFSQIAKVIGKGSENSVRNSLSKARVNRDSLGDRKDLSQDRNMEGLHCSQDS